MSSHEFPLVSILISAFQQAEQLPIAIQSALDQSYPNLEVVVCDDASKENVEHVFATFRDKRLKCFINESNLGRTQNYRRLVYELSSGDYITMLNADDYYIDMHYIQKAIDTFLKNENIGLVHAYNKVLIVNSERIIQKSISHRETKIIDGTEFFLNSPFVQTIEHLTAIYSRKVAEEIDVYRIDTMSQDWEFLLRMIVGRKLAIIPTFAGMITRHDSNVSAIISEKEFADHDRYIHSIFEYLNQKKLLPLQELKKWKFFMLKRHHIKWLIKSWFIDAALEVKYVQFLKMRYPDIHGAISNDMRFKMYKLIRNSDILMTFAFKYFLNQENFIADLQSRKNKPSHDG
jgi:glycosyltransferase involved in cell wall biosynthesis